MSLFHLLLPSWLFSEMDGTCGTQDEMRNAHKNLFVKVQGKITLGTKICRVWDDIKTDPRGLECKIMDEFQWIDTGSNSGLDENINLTLGSIKQELS
jgi:hypothetical protein